MRAASGHRSRKSVHKSALLSRVQLLDVRHCARQSFPTTLQRQWQLQLQLHPQLQVEVQVQVQSHSSSAMMRIAISGEEQYHLRGRSF
jgi:hypothetical protein